ncbi:MAG: hypothetical protein FH753_10560 [Firmicutes bacterium]|nr:hypothetical protein [Bacillota bacterium]
MNAKALLGLLALIYSGFVIFLTIKKPTKIWSMKKIQWFEKALGKKGTEIFFYIWSLLFVVLGIWLLTK